jgi:anti-anti-sigma regulatory factor
VLKLAGEHDLSTAPAIDAAFERISATGMTVVVDFTQTSFIDSKVVAALVRRSRGGETLLLVVPRGMRCSQDARPDRDHGSAEDVRDSG